MRAFAAFTSLALMSFTAAMPAQTRVVLGGVPSNLLLDLSGTVTALDGTAPDAFFALMPVSNGGSSSFDFAVFVAASVLTRGLRFFIVAGLLRQFGEPIREFVEKYLTLLFFGFLLLVIGGFVALKYI